MGNLSGWRNVWTSASRHAHVSLAVGFACTVALPPTLLMAASPDNVVNVLVNKPPHGACMPSLVAAVIACALAAWGGERGFVWLARTVKPLALGIALALLGAVFLVPLVIREPVDVAVPTVVAISGALMVVLYLLWMRAFGALAPRDMFLTLFVSQMLTCAINAVMTLSNSYTVLFAAVVLPLVSVFCLRTARSVSEQCSYDARRQDGTGALDPPRLPKGLLVRLAVVVFLWGAVDHLLRGEFDALLREQLSGSPFALAYHVAAFMLVIASVGCAYGLFALKDRFHFGHLYRVVFLLGLASILLLPVVVSEHLPSAGFACSVAMYQFVFLFVWIASATVFSTRSYDAPRFFGIVCGCWSLGSFFGALFSTELVQHLTVENAGLAALVLALAAAVGYTTVFSERDANLIVQIAPFKRRKPFREKCLAVASAHKLSPRETEIAMLIAQGRDSAHIQEKLFLSRSTVQTHRMHIYQKLDIHNRQELLDMIEQAGEAK